MLRTKLSRHTLAFALIVATSILLYPVAQSKNDLIIWILLALVSAAAILTILKAS